MTWPPLRAVDADSEVESEKIFYYERAVPLTGARIPLYHNCLILLSLDEAINRLLAKVDGVWYTPY